MIRVDVGTMATLLDAGREGWGDATAVARVTGVITDSREITPGDVYVARRGEHLDGARFAADAVAAGAVAVVADRALEVPTLVVPDAQEALVRIAGIVRARTAATVVGITGSVGKTTTKDLLAAAAGASRSTVAARGSHNNEVGVPLTVCRASDDTEVLVVELGARGRGHIADLVRWVRPDVAVVATVAGAHLELFHSLDEVARAKVELVEGLGPDGIAVLNADDERVLAMADRAPGRVVTVSAQGSATADLVAREVVLDGSGRAAFNAATPWGTVPVALPIVGRHHVTNALLALAATVVAGGDLAAGAATMATAPVSTGRGRLVVTRDGLRVLDDTYNANPTSVLAALAALADLDVPGRRAGVLGVMAEIGAAHEDEHRRVGAATAGVLDHLVVVGGAAVGLAVGARSRDDGPTVVEVDDVRAARAAVDDLGLGDGDALLVKASRVAGLERLVDSLVDERGTLPSGADGTSSVAEEAVR